MKKLLVVLAVAILALVHGYPCTVKTAEAVVGYVDNYTLLKSVTATGTGTELKLDNPTYDLFTCVVTWGGTTPTNTVVALEGSLDGTTYAALATQTITATGQMFHVADKPVLYIRGNYVSKSGGDATTAVTLRCSAVAR